MKRTHALARVGGLSMMLLAATLAGGRAEPPDRDITQPPRWAVMTGTDTGAARIKPTPTRTTIEKLGALPRPAALPPQGDVPSAYRARRLAPAETTLWAVEGTLTEARLNDDGDYHLTLRSASGQTLSGELPDPQRMEKPGPFAARMSLARRHLQARGHFGVKARVRVTGLGYFGRVRPGASGPKNGLQLHPIVDIAFL